MKVCIIQPEYSTDYSRSDELFTKELELLEKIKAHLEDDNMARSFEVNDEDELALLESYNLLTYKPVIFAANVAEDDLMDDGASNEGVASVREYAEKENCEVFSIQEKDESLESYFVNLVGGGKND